MKKWLLIVGLMGMLVWVNGCIVIDTEKADTSWKSEVNEPEDVTIKEIDAVGKLSMEDHRFEGYQRIARRHRLSNAAQVHLVEAVFANLSMEETKVDVLRTLIRNRCFRSDAKAAILERLDGLDSEESRREILDAMSKK